MGSAVSGFYPHVGGHALVLLGFINIYMGPEKFLDFP